jgi:hypothetical protein
VTIEGMGGMSETPHKKPDFLEVAKHQLAQISAEFEKALEALKRPRASQAADFVLSRHAAKGPVESAGHCREVSREDRAGQDDRASRRSVGARLVSVTT